MNVSQIKAALLLALAAAALAAGQNRQSAEFEIINLYDAFGKERQGAVQDFGFSALIRYRGKTILFDAGTNARILEQNVKAIGVDLASVDIAIVSHSHYDHIGGFDHLLEKNPKVKIYLPQDFTGLGAPSAFPFKDVEPSATKKLSKDEIYFRGERSTDGMINSPTGRFWKSDIEYVTSVKEVLPGLTLVPTRAALMGTFNRYPPFSEDPQFTGLPELSATFSTPDGNVIVSGCSHSGIENIVAAARSASKGRTQLLVGGFHLIPYGRAYIEGLISKLRGELEVDGVAPAHCTGHLAFVMFRERFGDKYRFFGLGEKAVLNEGKR
jgi:7,8-dihydropterin-6-yl-methyl-4-(beta-D-ribofuranosyl)aminobenzene 5'-phosphate synthase